MNTTNLTPSTIQEFKGYFESILNGQYAINRTVGDIAAKLEELNERMSTAEQREPTVVMRTTEVESIASKFSKGTGDLERMISEQRKSNKHSKLKDRIYMGVISVLLVFSMIIAYRYFSESNLRDAAAIIDSNAGLYWNTEKAALDIMDIGNSHRKEAKRYRGIILTEDNWAALEQLAKIKIDVKAIDGIIMFNDNDMPAVFYHILDKNGDPRSILVRGSNALISKPMSRKAFKKVTKAKQTSDIIENLDGYAVFKDGEWERL